jgi:hypothetical protein
MKYRKWTMAERQVLVTSVLNDITFDETKVIFIEAGWQAPSKGNWSIAKQYAKKIKNNIISLDEYVFHPRPIME